MTLCTVATPWGQTVIRCGWSHVRVHHAGCNAGPAEAAVQLPGQDAAAPLAVQRATYARALGLPALLNLMSRVDSAHQQVLLPAARPLLLMVSAGLLCLEPAVAAPLHHCYDSWCSAAGTAACAATTKAAVPALLQACSAAAEPQELVPPGAPLQQSNTEVPFSIKHARQQVHFSPCVCHILMDDRPVPGEECVTA